MWRPVLGEHRYWWTDTGDHKGRPYDALALAASSSTKDRTPTNEVPLDAAHNVAKRNAHWLPIEAKTNPFSLDMSGPMAHTDAWSSSGTTPRV